MPVPYQPATRTAAEGQAAYLELVEVADQRQIGLLVVDGLGRPIEFVYNRVTRGEPDWAEAPRATAVADLAHSVFDACRTEPDLLLISAAVGPSDFCRAVLAPAVPCALQDEATGMLHWLGERPAGSLRGVRVRDELERRGLTGEPFERIRAGLKAVYGQLEDG